MSDAWLDLMDCRIATADAKWAAAQVELENLTKADKDDPGCIPAGQLRAAAAAVKVAECHVKEELARRLVVERTQRVDCTVSLEV